MPPHATPAHWSVAAPDERSPGIALALLAAAGFASISAVSNLAYDAGVSVWAFTAWRGLIGALVLGLPLLALGRWVSRAWAVASVGRSASPSRPTRP